MSMSKQTSLGKPTDEVAPESSFRPGAEMWPISGDASSWRLSCRSGPVRASLNTSAAPVRRRLSHSGWRATSQIHQRVGEGGEGTNQEVDAEIAGAQGPSERRAKNYRQRVRHDLPEHEVKGVSRDRAVPAFRRFNLTR